MTEQIKRRNISNDECLDAFCTIYNFLYPDRRWLTAEDLKKYYITKQEKQEKQKNSK